MNELPRSVLEGAGVIKEEFGRPFRRQQMHACVPEANIKRRNIEKRSWTLLSSDSAVRWFSVPIKYVSAACVIYLFVEDTFLIC